MPETSPTRERPRFGESLRLRVLLLVLSAFLGVAVPAAFAFTWLVDSTVVKLGTLFAEKQVLYDRLRGLEALMREVALAETLARSPTIRAWAKDESGAGSRKRGLDELEQFRLAFRDRSYFFVVHASGNYYFNDSGNSFAGKQLRYALEPNNPRDGWYYKTAALGAGCHLNVDNDDKLAVTKVWINCVVNENGRVLGILGTGIDLTTFIRDVVNADQAGVDSLFVDRFGAVQAVRDASRIDFHSLTKEAGAKKTVFQMLDSDADRSSLAELLRNVARGGAVEARFVHLGGHKMLVGVGYLDRLGWYNVTFMDVDRIIDRGLFLPIGVLILLVMVAAAGLITYLFKRSVLDRLARTEHDLTRVEAGDFSVKAPDSGRDEISRLSDALQRMAASVRDSTGMLERAVEERTEELRRIAYLDPATGALNRRGFADAFERLSARPAKPGTGTGLLLLDIDRFKGINDVHGHSAGDAVICEFARRLSAVACGDNVVARWGGDEFVVLVPGCTREGLAELAGKILEAVRDTPATLSSGARLRLTTSIGAHVLARSETLDAAAHCADLALYAAKREGRNRTVFHEGGQDGEGRSRVA